MILGEGAVCCLEIGRKENALAFIEGIGYATEFWTQYFYFRQLVFKIDENGLEKIH
jgi:hypothetical protein